MQIYGAEDMDELVSILDALERADPATPAPPIEFAGCGAEDATVAAHATRSGDRR